MLLSIIIPVYKVEQYLESCIKSVLTQRGDETEIILVDDGSPDKCPELCDYYAAHYDNVKVIHKKNRGLSAARNTGINKASGEYLLFLDSDDLILNGKLKYVYDILEKHTGCDVLMFTYLELDQETQPIQIGGQVEGMRPGYYFVTREILCNIVKKCRKIWPAWKSVVRADFVKNNDLHFADGFIHEDVDWTSKLLLFCRSLYYSESTWYGYRTIRKGAITENITIKNFNNLFSIVSGVFEIIDRNSIGINKISGEIKERLSETCFSMLRAYKTATPHEVESMCTRISNDIKLLSYSRIKQHRCFYFFCKIFGAKNALRIYSKIYIY